MTKIFSLKRKNSPINARRLGSNGYLCRKPKNQREMMREAIKKAMDVKGISQVDLADELGVSKSSICNYLAGRRKMSVENIEKAFQYLGLRIVLNDSTLRHKSES